jgi:transcription termination factor Rho
MHIIQAINKVFTEKGIYISDDKVNRYSVSWGDEELIICQGGHEIRIPLNGVSFKCFWAVDKNNKIKGGF